MPTDPAAAAALLAWSQAADDDTTLDASQLDLSGADLALATLFDTNLTDAKLTEADLYRAQSADAVLDRADLTGASLVKADLRDTRAHGAVLTRANLGSAELWKVDAHSASLRYASLNGAALLHVSLTAADLTGASAQNTTLNVTLDESTVVAGLNGQIYGPAHLVENGVVRELAGLELKLWLNERGASVQVLNSAPGGTVYFARVDAEFPRSHPAGVMRRRRAGDIVRDEAFTRNLSWEPTEYFRRYELGSNDGEHVEISEEEANRFVVEITLRSQRLRGPT
ncbi:pentapeptide repeat-containing protein [Streptomyces sp. NPDC003717]|uniref:pentapeptide repeat-containing protein n=1 Tax=Streptomyces sp. NPDC003717 TaxID=3154276 RepID=UPI0033B76DFD